MVNIDYVLYLKYLLYKNLWRKCQLFDMDFIFYEILEKYVLFDFEIYFNSLECFFVGMTDCEIG